MDVMESRVSKGMKALYCHSNAQFILWIYFGNDSNLKQQIIAPLFLDKLKEVERATWLQSANMSFQKKTEENKSSNYTNSKVGSQDCTLSRWKIYGFLDKVHSG
jgi:hypothetical protein